MDVDSPMKALMGGSVIFVPLMESSAGFLTATLIKTTGKALGGIKSRNTQLDTLMGLKMKRVRHAVANLYASSELQYLYSERGIMSEKTASYVSQQNRKAERAKSCIMERVRAALLSAEAEEELCAEALSPVIHVLSLSLTAVQGVKLLEALKGRLPDVDGFRFWGSRAWELKPKRKLRKLESGTEDGGFVRNMVGGEAYRVLEDDSNKIFLSRDVRMEVISSTSSNRTAGSVSSSSPRLIFWTGACNEDGAMEMLDLEDPGGEEYARHNSSSSDDSQDE